MFTPYRGESTALGLLSILNILTSEPRFCEIAVKVNLTIADRSTVVCGIVYRATSVADHRRYTTMATNSCDAEHNAEDMEDFRRFVTFCYNSMWGGSPSPQVIMTGGCRSGVRMSSYIDVMLPEYNVIALPLEGEGTDSSFIRETFSSDTILYIYTLHGILMAARKRRFTRTA